MEASDLGETLLGQVREKLRHQWDELGAMARADITAAITDVSALALAGAAGVDVAAPLAEALATIASWAWTAASVAQRVVLDVLATAFRMAGEFLAGLAERMLTG